ncbi:MAG: TcfC E-set like domain-containing protein [Sphingomicrobium sp.]
MLAVSNETPQGFALLSEPRQMLADVYFGGTKIGEAAITVRPGFVRFHEPAKVVAAIPHLRDAPAVQLVLAGEMSSNSGSVCSALKSENCGTLSPQVAALIFDEDRFRIDLFVNSELLEAIFPVAGGYLSTPTGGLSMTSSTGLSLSGSSQGRTAYNLQNRTIIAAGGARLRVNSSYSSGLGLITDDFVAEIDRRNLRFSAGMFWAPGLDMIGQRRIIGAGVTTQMDTRADKELLEGTPLFLFLDRAARVEVLSDGRLLDSRIYEAGNNRIDTTYLPSGAYSLVLRVHQADGRVREEQRFFARNAQVAPVGKPIYFAFAGVLANTRRNRPFSPSRTHFYQAGTAHRLTGSLAIDASVIGTQHNTMFEAGGYLLSPSARIRAAGLISAKGDKGVLLQAGTSGSGPLSLHLDLRRIWSQDQRPLIPLPTHGERFDLQAPTAAQLGVGSFTQASASVGYRVGNGFVGLTGAFRRDYARRSDYSIGPNLSVPVLQRHGVQLMVQADAQRTRSSTAAYAGIRLLTTSNGKSLIATGGYASLGGRGNGEPSSARPVGSIAGEYYHQAKDRTEMSLGVAAERTVTDANARVHGAIYSPLGTVRGDLLRYFGDRAATQYGLSVQTGIAVNSSGSALGGRELTQSALLVSVDGRADGAAFDVLVDNVPRGRISAGRSLPVYLASYRSYSVRLKPADAAPVSYDNQAKKITLYPGTVQSVRWTVQRTFTVFGQALAADGAPVAAARVESAHGLGETDEQGFFQVDMADGDELRFSRGRQPLCRALLTNPQPERGYAAAGKVLCL